MKTPKFLLLNLILLCVLPAFAQELYINETVARNTIFYDNYGETDDWLELYNASAEAINLNAYYLSDDANDLAKWQIETDIIIPSEGFSLFWLDDDISQGANHASFKLSQEGETLFLSKEIAGELTIISALAASALSEDVSYGRKENGGSALTTFWEPTPLATNNTAGHLSEDTVLFSLASGDYPAGTPISLSSIDNSTELYYTTDGTRPNATNNIYNGFISLENSLYLRVIAASDNQEFSRLFDAFYVMEDLHDLPVIHLGINTQSFIGEDWGIYVRGNNGVPGSCDGTGANWHRDWERDLRFLYLENEGNVSAQAELKIGGACSRNIVMKSLIIDFKEEEVLDYSFFPNSNISKYHKLKLRGSGHDFTKTHLRDGALQESLQGQTEIDLMAYRPVVVYVNGEYYGVYNVREVMDKNYIITHYDLEEDEFDMIKLPFHDLEMEVKAGDDIAFQDLINFVENNDLKDSTNFQIFTEMVDVENMTDYFIAEMFVANFDWPTNNMTMWR